MIYIPFSARGSHYYGNALNFLSCKVDHEQIANKLFENLKAEGKSFGTTSCDSCGAYITVSQRGAEWETRIFSRGGGKER